MEDKSFILERAKYEQQKGNYQESLNLLEQIFDINDYSISFECAKTLYLLKRYEDAIDIFIKLYEYNQKDNNLIDLIIKCYEETGNYQKSLDLLKQIFNINNYFIAFEYAKTLYFLKRYEDAIDILLILNKNNKKDNIVIDFIIKCYKESDKLEELICFIRQNNISNSILLSDSLDFLLKIGDKLFKDKKYKDSVMLYEQYIKGNPENINVVSKLLQIYNFLGYKQKVIELSDKYLKNTQIQNNKFLYNLFLNEQEIAKEKIVLQSKPRIMLVMLTNKCNLRCPMCDTVRQKNQWEISDVFKRYILNNLDNLELITWQGGEVFLYKDFKDLFLKAKGNKYLKQIIITNGLLINEQWADLITQSNHLDLTISIDSIEKDIYEKLRFGASFEKLLQNLECIKQYRIKNNSNITVTMRTAISNENIYTLDKIVDFAINYNINVLVWSPLSMEGNKQYSLKNKSDDDLVVIKTNIDNALNKAQKNKIKIIYLLENAEDILNERNKKTKEEENSKQETSLRQECKTKYKCSNMQNKNDNLFVSSEKSSLCFRPWKQIATMVEGKLRPECLCLQDIGDINNCNNFEELWNNNFMQEYRRKMISFNQQWCCDNCKNNIVSEEHKKFVCW